MIVCVCMLTCIWYRHLDLNISTLQSEFLLEQSLKSIKIPINFDCKIYSLLLDFRFVYLIVFVIDTECGSEDFTSVDNNLVDAWNGR